MEKFCSNCGAKLHDGADVCTSCGTFVAHNKETKKEGNTTIINNNIYGRGPYNKWVAFVLCFFLGCLGIHKFYEGKIGMGILYIFTGGLFGIGWLVDWIVILTKPEQYYL